MKLDKHFKFPKAYKTLLANTPTELKSATKKALISAAYTAQDKSISRFVMNYDVSEKKARQILAQG